MKCQKCGYNSFDYLSECRKCSVDLSDTRDKLGFYSLKPSDPFFLASLLRDYQTGGGSTPVMAAAAEAGADLAGIDLATEVSLDLDFSDLEEAPGAGDTFPGQAQMRQQLDSARKVMEDIEQTAPSRTKAGTTDEMELDLDSVLDAATTPDARKQPAAASKTRDVITEDMEIELSVEDLDQFIEESGPQGGAKATVQPTSTTTTAEVEDIDSLLMGAEELPTTEKGMAIELSTEDLEGLLLEMDESPEEDEEKTK